MRPRLLTSGVRCGRLRTSGNSTPPDRRVYYAVVGELEAKFPDTNGLSWPSGEGVRFRYSHDNYSATCLGQSDYSIGSLVEVTLTPGNPKATVMWVKEAAKTPNDPQGRPMGVTKWSPTSI